ncbi:LysR family transcriptional regulator [Streptomyces phaeofaciens JCM 4814]|uniref:Transcriptional regulator n=1 Tax=Streptomyces phaeofaciens TaxID=68254 RepID=A0A918HIX7_9ACTN|nr:LysR family transcriptional regulator [Streptomyces phaeofaciens]GGT64167.1 transcriptional regulator [Streptomyces phaeofaciens]
MERPDLPPLPQLNAFLVLAEELHFGRAAGRLGIAQPPLSQQIRRLEDRVGHALFQRSPAGVTLTPAGRALLPAARRALTGLTDGLTAARAAGDGRTGRLRVGFAASLALTLLPDLLRTHRDRLPGVHLDLREMTTAPQLTALRGGGIDVGLLREPPPSDPGLSFRTIATEPFVAVLPAAHPLAERPVTPLGDLADAPFVLLPREAGPGLHDRITALCATAGFTPRVTQEAVEWLTVCALVGTGLGVSLAPAALRRLRLPDVAFRPLPPPAGRTTVAAAWRTDDGNPLVSGLLATLTRSDRER